VAEPGSDVVTGAMAEAAGWFMCRVGFVETVRAVGLAAGAKAMRTVENEWSAFGVIEVDQRLADHAAHLALAHGLRSLDSLHLAAALALPSDDLLFATRDRRLHVAAAAEHLQVIPMSFA